MPGICLLGRRSGACRTLGHEGPRLVGVAVPQPCCVESMGSREALRPALDVRRPGMMGGGASRRSDVAVDKTGTRRPAHDDFSDVQPSCKAEASISPDLMQLLYASCSEVPSPVNDCDRYGWGDVHPCVETASIRPNAECSDEALRGKTRERGVDTEGRLSQLGLRPPFPGECGTRWLQALWPCIDLGTRLIGSMYWGRVVCPAARATSVLGRLQCPIAGYRAGEH